MAQEYKRQVSKERRRSMEGVVEGEVGEEGEEGDTVAG